MGMVIATVRIPDPFHQRLPMFVIYPTITSTWPLSHKAKSVSTYMVVDLDTFSKIMTSTIQMPVSSSLKQKIYQMLMMCPVALFPAHKLRHSRSTQSRTLITLVTVQDHLTMIW